MRWAVEVHKTHVSLRVLSCYRSQHDNLSWLAALTAILDTPALLIATAMKVDTFQAELTFVPAGHKVSDLAQSCYIPPIEPDPVQLPQQQLQGLHVGLEPTGLNLRPGDAIDQRMTELRGMYEPSVNVLGRHFLLKLPLSIPDSTPVDNWQTSATMRRTCGLGRLALPEPGDDHRD